MNLFMDVFLNICTLLSGYLALWKLLDKREMPNRFLWNCAKWGYVLLAAFLQALVSQLHIPWLNLGHHCDFVRRHDKAVLPL